MEVTNVVQAIAGTLPGRAWALALALCGVLAVCAVGAPSSGAAILTGAANNNRDGPPIWMAGAGPVADAAGNIFFSPGAPGHTPAGHVPGYRPPSGLAESVVRLRVAPSGARSASSFFTPCNAGSLDAVDRDLNSGGVVALPEGFGSWRHRALLLAGGKSAKLYLLAPRLARAAIRAWCGP